MSQLLVFGDTKSWDRFTFIVVFLMTTFLFVLSTGKPTSTSKNHDLLTKLGLQKIRGPNSHHRKRLAVESRHHSRSDDSHMFIIKLPPNQHYYAYNQPNAIPDIHTKSKNLPVVLKNNGKPARVYHWNIPMLKKWPLNIRQKASDLKIDYTQPENWNEVLDKPEKRKPLKPSYYVPAKPKKSSFTKYFPGNGKPHSFYVIENSRKAHYHRLLP